jgi:OmpA-like transmembrane domain
MQKKSLVFALLTALCGFAQAQESGFYIGGGAGQASFDDSIAEQIQDAYTPQPRGVNFAFRSAVMTDDSDTSFKGFIGYKFMPWLGAELAWHDLGKVGFDYSLTARSSTGQVILSEIANLSSEVSVQGPSLSVVGDYAFNEQFSGKLRLGLLDAEIDYRESGSNDFRNSDNHSARLIGLSGQYQLTPQWGVRGDWDHIIGVGKRFDLGSDSNGEFESVDVLSLNLVYNFNL